jgi:MFS family permease
LKSTPKKNFLLETGLKPLTNARWTGYQKSIVFMLFLAMTFAYMDRINLSVAMPVFINQYHIKPSTAGLLLSIFNWSIALSMLVSGPLIDYFRPKKILPLGVAIWSVATWITSLSINIFPLAFARGLLGVGEATLIPSASRIISEVFKKEDRGKVMGIYFSGSKVGLTLGAPLAGGILVAYGWQAIFCVTSAISAAWLLLWLPIYRSHKGIVPSEIYMGP